MRQSPNSGSKRHIAGSSGLLPTILLVLALMLGGGGSPAPLPEISLECFTALFAVLWILGTPGAAHWSRVPRTAWIISSMIAAVPLLQLVPLPPIIWHALPGRAVELDALTLIGEQSSWRSLALAPARTLSSLLSLGPPLLLLTMTSALDKRGRLELIWGIAIVAALTLVVGALQHGAGEESPLQFYGDMSHALLGFQANQNSTADFLLVALMTGPLLVRSATERGRIPNRSSVVLVISGASMAVCALAVVLTSSRMGIALLPVPVFASLWILRPWIQLTRLAFLAVLVAAVVVLLLSFALAQTNPVLAHVIARFSFDHELRPQLWRDSLFAAKKYFPFGVGMGDFIPAYIADERLEVIEQLMPNRAHNDLIELTVEAGLPGLGVLSTVYFLIIREVWLTRGAAKKLSPDPICFASAALGIFALHSIVDYPFRSLALACLGGVCAGLILTPRRNEPAPANGQRSGPPEE